MNEPKSKPTKSWFRKLIKLVNFDDPLIFFQRLLLIIIAVLVTIDVLFYPFVSSFFQNIIIEAHGIVPDLLIFGILMTIYERWRGKVEVHLGSMEEYMNQHTPEATAAILNIIKEMNKMEASRFQLSECTLSQQDMRHLDFTGSSFHRVNFEESDLTLVELDKCRLRDVNFSKAILRSVTFSGSDLDKINFSGAKLNDANFHNADLRTIDFSFADLRFWKNSPESIEMINLEGAMVESKQWIKKRLVDANVIGWRKVADTYDVDPTPFEDERGVYYLIKSKTTNEI